MTNKGGTYPASAPTRLKRIVSALARLALVVLLLGGVGHLLRDRNLPLAMLMYVPLPLIGAAVVILDLFVGGRCVSRPRFAATGLGATFALWGAWPLAGISGPAGPDAGPDDLKIVHWNTQWGGAPGIGAHTDAIAGKIRADAPDVVVLSEGPNEAQMAWVLRELGGSWNKVQHVNLYPDGYAIKLVVCSPWPLTHDGVADITDGQVLFATAQVRGRPVRVAVVDARSQPWLPRTRRLRDALVVCQARAEVGQPVDIIAGDFNSLGRSIGFDLWRDAGWQLAADRAAGWRATWPRWFPLYDVDHVWVRPGGSVTACNFFSEGTTDHRGQTVRARLFP